MAKLNKIETHKKAVQYAACNLIENEIVTRAGTGRGIDLILDNGKTILVRGMNEEIAAALMNGSLDQLKADYLVIATNQRYTCSQRVYIMTMDEAKAIADDNPYKEDGRNNWFISPVVYRKYREKYSILE
jgi:hypothetical protein